VGGSGGGSTFRGRSPGELREQVRKAEGKAAEAATDGQLAGTLGELLATVNGRDVELVRPATDSLPRVMLPSIRHYLLR